MPETKLHNRQLPDTIKSKTIDSTNTISTDLTKLSIAGGTNGQVLSTNGSGSLSFITAGGGISDGDKGDITVSSSGATWTIDNDAVTYAKIQNVTTNRLLGRVSSGSGDTEEVTIGSGLSVSGTTLSALGAPTAVVTKSADETVTNTTTLQDDDHLLYSMTNGKYYRVWISLFVSRTNTSTGPGFRLAIGGNSDGYWSESWGAQIGSLLDGTINRTFTTWNTNAGVPAQLNAFATVKATADFTFQVRFAQFSAQSATGITIMKNSQLIIWDLGT